MRQVFSGAVNFIGARLIPFQNTRVVCPPGKIIPQGRRNILVATPRRSGTHILIDLILNNLPAYRQRPLYVDLDQCWRRSQSGPSLMEQVTPEAGYVIKTHLPIQLPQAVTTDPQILGLAREALVLTVRRDRNDVTRSMMRWREIGAQPATFYETLYDDFWAFWGPRDQIPLDFADLFDPAKMQVLIGHIARETGTAPRPDFRPAPDKSKRNMIYFNKTLTRLIGRHAPVTDTTIHTLK